MKVARRHTAALILGILVIMGGYAFLQVRHEVVLFEADSQTGNSTLIFGSNRATKRSSMPHGTWLNWLKRSKAQKWN